MRDRPPREAIDAAEAIAHGDIARLDRQWGPEATTPLHDAVRANDQDLVERLIAAGADLTLRDAQWHGRPLEWANALGYLEAVMHFAGAVAYHLCHGYDPPHPVPQ